MNIQSAVEYFVNRIYRPSIVGYLEEKIQDFLEWFSQIKNFHCLTYLCNHFIFKFIKVAAYTIQMSKNQIE